MITGRRYQEFHDLLEGGSTAPGSSYAELVDVVHRLRATPAPVADPRFVAELREQLIAEAETVLAAAAAEQAEIDTRPPLAPAAHRVRRRNRRVAAAITGTVLVGGSATMAVAAQSSLPGDPLYPVKRDIESAHAGLTFDRAGRGAVLLDSASNRLDEARALSRADADPARVDDALAAFTSQAMAGSDLLVQDYRSSGDDSSMTTVRTFTASTRARLLDLEPVVPTASLPQLRQAVLALDQIDSVSVPTCPACSSPLATVFPTVLTDATRMATGTWTTRTPHGGQNGTRPHRGGQGPSSSGPALPQHGGNPLSGSVTEPPPAGASSDGVTGNQVEHTTHELTVGLTGGHQDPLPPTVSQATSDASETVGQVGDAVTGPVADTVGGVQSALPSDVASNLPSLP